MNNKQINLRTIGADIEMFLCDRKTKEVVSAEGIIRGSKQEPYQFDPDNPKFATSLDNVLVEFCIPEATSAKQWVANINKAMAYVKSIIPKELDILPVPSASLDEKWLQTEQAQTFGCEVDFNAYTMGINSKPHADDHCLRSSGGHIHMGFDEIEVPFKNLYRYSAATDSQRANIIKVLDLFIGVPSVILEPDNKRKELYGKAGAYRPKIYGVEYRTPSNFYLANNNLKKWAFDSAKNAIAYINKNGYLEDGLANHIQRTINNNSKTDAMDLVNEFKLSLV